MTKIQLSTGYLRNGIIILFVLFAVIEIISWSWGYNMKMDLVNRTGGFPAYISRLIKGLLLPELVTVFILTRLIESTRRWFNITAIQLTRPSLVRYELSFLPVMLCAFVLFIPFTQTARYLLDGWPTYTFSTYWNRYLLIGYSWRMYFMYLIPILFVGYCTLNISLLSDVQKQSHLSTIK